MTITLTSSSFSTAEEIVRPCRLLGMGMDPDEYFSLIERIEQAIAEAADPPEWLCAQDADRYSKRKWRMAFLGKDRPAFRRIGAVNYYLRSEIDAWATARIKSRPAVPHAAF